MFCFVELEPLLPLCMLESVTLPLPSRRTKAILATDTKRHNDFQSRVEFQREPRTLSSLSRSCSVNICDFRPPPASFPQRTQMTSPSKSTILSRSDMYLKRAEVLLLLHGYHYFLEINVHFDRYTCHIHLHMERLDRS
jgi:hypothetical protein